VLLQTQAVTREPEDGRDDLRRALLGEARAGAALVCEAGEAFALRVALARAARRSLDLQYYAWHGDLTGRLMAREALAAADRGVRVRMLLDDMFAIGRDRTLAALDAHPAVEVRIFNTTRWRALGQLGFWLEMLLGGRHLNHRMHNKAFVADGCLALTGGRNIGDEYFDANETFNFRDVDLLLAGDPAARLLPVFDRFWQSALARRAREVSASRDARGGLPALRASLDAFAASEAARRLVEHVPPPAALAERLGRGFRRMPPAAFRIVADPPEKARRGLGARRRAKAAGGIGPDIAEALRAARQEALVISPYFVPGEAGLALLAQLAARGVRVVVVTNSLAATDVVAVHGGYARYRRRLIAAGIALHEIKASGDAPASLLGSRGASLHGKAFVIDDGPICVGSFNLDPRSTALNTEMGVFADHPELARALRAELLRLADPGRSWRVGLEDGRLAWRAGATLRHAEPGASLRRRLVAALVRLLPVERHL
jgi:putative cardiolipin synthase